MNLKKISTLIGNRLGLRTASPEPRESGGSAALSSSENMPVVDTLTEPASSPAISEPTQEWLSEDFTAASPLKQSASATDEEIVQAGSSEPSGEGLQGLQQEKSGDNAKGDRVQNTDLAVEDFSFEDSNMEEEDQLFITDYSPEQLAKSKQKLMELMRSCSGVYGVLIHTVDGHDLQSVITRDIPAAKISTMTSSFLALGETIARESLQKFCQYAMLENSNGRVVSLRINDILMLTCVSSKDSNPGMLLSLGKSTADAISKILVYRHKP